MATKATAEIAKWKFSGERVSQILSAGLDEARPKRGQADVQTNRPLVRQADTRQQFLRLRGRHAARLPHRDGKAVALLESSCSPGS